MCTPDWCLHSVLLLFKLTKLQRMVKRWNRWRIVGRMHLLYAIKSIVCFMSYYSMECVFLTLVYILFPLPPCSLSVCLVVGAVSGCALAAAQEVQWTRGRRFDTKLFQRRYLCNSETSWHYAETVQHSAVLGPSRKVAMALKSSIIQLCCWFKDLLCGKGPNWQAAQWRRTIAGCCCAQEANLISSC